MADAFSSLRVRDICQRDVVAVSKDDTVLYAKYAGTEVKIENKKYLILKETDVLAIVQ